MTPTSRLGPADIDPGAGFMALERVSVRPLRQISGVRCRRKFACQ